MLNKIVSGLRQSAGRQAKNPDVPVLGPRLDDRGQHPGGARHVQAALHPRLQRDGSARASRTRPRPLHRQSTFFKNIRIRTRINYLIFAGLPPDQGEF
jgi:hypothetical protein